MVRRQSPRLQQLQQQQPAAPATETPQPQPRKRRSQREQESFAYAKRAEYGAHDGQALDAFEPLGQERVPLHEEERKLFDSYRKSPSSWPASVPSFELWCALTGYDPLSPHGGNTFQDVMHSLLAKSSGGGGKPRVGVHAYFVNGKRASSEWHKAKPTDYEISKGGSSRYVFSARGYGRVRHAGLDLGTAAGNDTMKSKKFLFNPNGNTKNAQLSVSVPRIPCTKIQWLQVTGSLQRSAAYVHGSLTNEFHSVGVNSHACKESDGCMSQGNFTAAFFGLYYYPGCEEEGRQWIVRQTIEGRTFHIRMRHWNPTYRLQRDVLYVNEKLNKDKAQEIKLTTLGEEGVGFAVGFGQLVEQPLTTSHLLRYDEREEQATHVGRVRLAPFFGDESDDPQAIRPGSMGTRDLCKDLKRAFAYNAHGKTESLVHYSAEQGTYFGFNVARAHFLYPRVFSVAELDVAATGSDAGENAFETFGVYQRWPVWKKNVYDENAGRSYNFARTEDRIDYRDLKGSDFRIYMYFEHAWDQDVTKRQRQLYALFDSLETQTARGTEQNVTSQLEAEPTMLEDVVTSTMPEMAVGEEEAETGARELDEGEVERLPPGQQQPIAERTDDQGALQIHREEAVLFTAFQTVEHNMLVDDALKNYEGGEGVEKNNGANMNKHRLDTNEHFTSYRYQPWPVSDLYEEAKMSLTSEGDMDSAEVEEYKRRYHTTHNLYLRGEQVPKKYSIKRNIGTMKDVYYSSLVNPDSEIHLRHLYTIVCIFYAKEALGRRTTPSVSWENKRRGMVYGVYRDGSGVSFPKMPPQDRRRQLWPPVFKGCSLTKEFNLSVGKIVFPESLFELNLGGSEIEVEISDRARELVKKLKSDMTVGEWVSTPWHYAYLPYETRKLVFADGETYMHGCNRCGRPFFEYKHMYAWHLNSRFEPAKSWPAMRWQNANLPETHAPLPMHDPKFWSEDTELPSDCAPNSQRVGPRATVQVQDTHRVTGEVVELTSGNAGWHNWYTRRFLLQNSGPLRKEFQAKTRANPDLKKHLQNRGNRDCFITFREYENYMHDPDIDYTTREVTQGRLTGHQAKVQFGMTGFRIQRAAKYGNVCQDCAAVLQGMDLLQHNYQVKRGIGSLRNARAGTRMNEHTWWTNLVSRMSQETLDELRDITGAEATEIPLQDIFIGQNSGRLSRLSGSEKADAERKYEQVMEIVDRELRALHGVEKFAETKFTKVSSTYVSVQPVFRGKGSVYDNKTDSDLITNALVDLQQLLQDGQLATGTLPKYFKFGKFVQVIEGLYGDPSDRLISDVLAYAQSKLKHHPDAASPKFREMVTYMQREMTRFDKFDYNSSKVFDSDVIRTEYRNKTLVHPISKKTYHNCLEILLYQPGIRSSSATRTEMKPGYVKICHYCTRKGRRGDKSENGGTVRFALKSDVTEADKVEQSSPYTQWNGDGFLLDYKASNSDNPWTLNERFRNSWDTQYRPMRQSRFFITYSLHRALSTDMEARMVLEKMADAVYEIFGNDRLLSELLVFGMYVRAVGQRDSVSQAEFVTILEPNKETQMFYGGTSQRKLLTFQGASRSGRGRGGGGRGRWNMPEQTSYDSTSYVHDTYETHVESVTLDAGVEIGPNRRHPHFHALVTVNHFSYVQIDYFKMKAYLEQMFRGVDPLGFGWGDRYILRDASGMLFYTDNENPHIDVRVHPQDNWQDVIAAYVRKNSVPGIFEALDARTSTV